MKKNFTKMILLFFVSMLTVGAWAQTPDKDYLCITAETAGAKVQLNMFSSPAVVTIEYSTDEGAKWTTVDFTSETTTGDITLTKVGDKVYFRNAKEAKDVTTFSESNSKYYYFTFTDSVSVSGNIMSLIDKNVESTTIPCNYCFAKLFNGCNYLTSAAELRLPAMTLRSSCYGYMFQFCTNLKDVPAELPATTLMANCYLNMFQKCSNITKAPKLPATRFGGQAGCYANMFDGCKKLNHVEVGFTAWNPTNATNDWLYDVAAEGTFVCPAELDTKTRDASHVPAGWMVTQPEPMRDYLCITAENAGAKVQLKKNESPTAVTIEYSTDEGANWTTVDFSSATTTGDITLTSVGDKVYFRNAKEAKEVTTFSGSSMNYYYFTFSDSVSASGNVMSLVDRKVESTTIPCSYCFAYLFTGCSTLTNAPALPATTLAVSCYIRMFSGCTGLTSAPALPVETLQRSCYNGMFFRCTGLTSAPELPATTLEYGCYAQMFSGCTGLTSAPELPATTLAGSCYDRMFSGCTGLTSAPALPAETLMTSWVGCYNGMFSDCTGLTSAPELPSTTLADGCYAEMFSGCTGLTSAPKLPATTLANGCYRSMFSGCINLNFVKVCFKEWRPDLNATEQWLYGVAKTGTLVCYAELNTDDAFRYGWIPAGWTIKKFADEFTFDDATPYTATNDIECESLTYKRTFESTVWQPLYVPFSIDITADLLQKCDIADIFMVSTKGSVTAGADPLDAGLSVTVIKKYIAGESTVAHTPYFIRPKTTGDFEFTQENTTVYAATEGMVDCTTTKDKYEFIGNYTAKTLSPTTGVAFYVLGTNGGLQCVAKTEDYNLAANRWHMKKTSRSNNPSALDADEKMSIVVLGEDDTTGIEGLNLNDNENDNFNKAVYNLQGQRVGSYNGYRGIVIKGGKKYILK